MCVTAVSSPSEKKRSTKGKSKKKPTAPSSTATLKPRKVTTPQASSPKPQHHKDSLEEHDPNGGTITPHQNSFSKDGPPTPSAPPAPISIAHQTKQPPQPADLEKLSPPLTMNPFNPMQADVQVRLPPPSASAKNPLESPALNFMDSSVKAVVDGTETASLHTCPSAFSDEDWSRKVSQDDGQDEWQRKFSNFTDKDDSRHNSVASSTTTSSASEAGGRVTASKKAARGGVADSCTSSTADGSTPSKQTKADEKLLRRRMKELLLWVKTLQLPPYDEIPSDGVAAAIADSEPFDMDSERRFSKID